MNNRPRRDFIRQSISLLASATGIGLVFAACSSGGNDTTQKKPSADSGSANTKSGSSSCDDLSGLTDSELAARKNLNYTDTAALKNKTCRLCALYIPPATGSGCGACALIKGPVKPEGTCTYWAKKEKSKTT